MEYLDIKSVDEENIDDLINLCIPQDWRNNHVFIEGAKVKRKWAKQVMKKYGDFAKIAYLNLKPVGLIQYLPKPEEKIVEITRIFVPKKEHQKCRNFLQDSQLRYIH